MNGRTKDKKKRRRESKETGALILNVNITYVNQKNRINNINEEGEERKE